MRVEALQNVTRDRWNRPHCHMEPSSLSHLRACGFWGIIPLYVLKDGVVDRGGYKYG